MGTDSSTYAKRREQGQCGSCGGVPDPGKATCGECREYLRKWYFDIRERRRRKKQCQRCGTTKDVRLRAGREKRINPKRKRHYICPKCEAYQVRAVKKSYLKNRARYVKDPSKPYDPYGRRTK